MKLNRREENKHENEAEELRRMKANELAREDVVMNSQHRFSPPESIFSCFIHEA